MSTCPRCAYIPSACKCKRFNEYILNKKDQSFVDKQTFLTMQINKLNNGERTQKYQKGLLQEINSSGGSPSGSIKYTTKQLGSFKIYNSKMVLKELTKPQYQGWKELEKKENKFWKKMEKRNFIYRGKVMNFRYRQASGDNEYLFLCKAVRKGISIFPSIRVKVYTKNDLQGKIEDGDILQLQGRLERGKPLEPDNIFNETKNIMVKY